MTASFVILCASGSVIFGLLFGRLFAWWGEVRDEERALADASIRARFDRHRWDEVVNDEEILVRYRITLAPPYDVERE